MTPDYNVTVARKGKDGKWHSTRVGAAWRKDNGSLSVAIDPGISIASTEGNLITLWPWEERGDRQPAPRSSAPQSHAPRDPGPTDDAFGDDDIPF